MAQFKVHLLLALLILSMVIGSMAQDEYGYGSIDSFDQDYNDEIDDSQADSAANWLNNDDSQGDDMVVQQNNCRGLRRN
jgi:hypothetical protein